MDIDKLIKLATLEKNGAAKEAYRAIKAELLINSSSKKPKPEGKEVSSIIIHSEKDSFVVSITELDLSIIKKLIKEREEQISMYDANSRKDLADMYREQLKYLKDLLPGEIDKEQLQMIVSEQFPDGITQKEMGSAIKKIKEICPIADGKLIAEVIKSNIVC